MKSQTIKVIDPIGLHARPASDIAQLASKFESDISFKIGEKIANAKSIINLMALGAKKDAVIEIIINGKDEEEALEQMLTTLKTKKII